MRPPCREGAGVLPANRSNFGGFRKNPFNLPGAFRFRQGYSGGWALAGKPHPPGTFG